MTSEAFYALLDVYEWESELDRRDSPLTLARLVELERLKGVRFSAFYKEFLSRCGADRSQQHRLQKTASGRSKSGSAGFSAFYK